MRVQIYAAILFMTTSAWATGPSPVVVELFESQGCSSCPPAERVMTMLQKEYGPSVLLLTYHVDYWDYLGWKDTFSDQAATDRQKMYAQVFAQDSIYTPEMVIQGVTGFTGSEAGRAKLEVETHRQANRPRFTLKVTPSGRVSVQLPPALASQAHRLTAVVYENADPVQVLRGENKGETMTGAFAVRKLAEMPAPKQGHTELSITLPAGTDPAKLSVAVLVEGPSAAILAAESAAL